MSQPIGLRALSFKGFLKWLVIALCIGILGGCVVAGFTVMTAIGKTTASLFGDIWDSGIPKFLLVSAIGFAFCFAIFALVKFCEEGTRGTKVGFRGVLGSISKDLSLFSIWEFVWLMFWFGVVMTITHPGPGLIRYWIKSGTPDTRTWFWFWATVAWFFLGIFASFEKVGAFIEGALKKKREIDARKTTTTVAVSTTTTASTSPASTAPSSPAPAQNATQTTQTTQPSAQPVPAASPSKEGFWGKTGSISLLVILTQLVEAGVAEALRIHRMKHERELSQTTPLRGGI